MATEAKLRQLADKGCPVYYFYSSERYLVRQAVAAATRILTADSDEDATVLDGAAPEIEQLIMAAGTISFFGTRRVATATKTWRNSAAPLPAWKTPWWCWAACLSWSAISSRWASGRKSSLPSAKPLATPKNWQSPSPLS